MLMEKQKILIVDDDGLNLNILGSILKQNYTLLFARNGTQALELIEKQLPDLILLDVVMPDIDGYQVINKIKHNELLKDIPVIFISALSDAEDEEKGLLLGAVDYISKPFNPAIVLARVRNHMKIVRQRKLLEKIALLDGLTEIPNRRSFEERFLQEFMRAKRNQNPLSMAILDVDNFKEYNDYYGHAMGDFALKKVAEAISNQLKRPADFVARIGGEEFAILLPDTPARGACHVAKTIYLSVTDLKIEHIHSASSEVLTVSIGGATIIPAVEQGELMLYKCADSMLYQAKGSGKNRVEWQDLGSDM